MKKRTGIKSIMSSVQLKFAAGFLLLIVGLLVVLNTYPIFVTRDLVFSSKQSYLQNQAGVISSALSTADTLTMETVSEVMGLLDLRAMTRIIITDAEALVLYDTATLDPAEGRYALFSELKRALDGEVVCFSEYNGEAFMTRQAMPIRNGGVTTGAVYLYEYDSQQAQLISEIQSDLLNIAVILGIVAVGLLLVFSRALTLRITELVEATQLVSAGDYDYLISVRGNDELSQLGDEFNKLTIRLKETEELRRRFVSDASHELKTPLASIRLLSDSIVNEESMDMDTMREFVTDIGAEAERLQRTTEKLLSLSKIDSIAEIDFTKIDVGTVAERTLRLLQPLADEHRVTISTDLCRTCSVYGNEDLIYRIIFNLAENGIKYNMPGGRVIIRLFCKDAEVKLIVEDTGIGIPDDDMPHIFSRFYRVDKARSREAGGSGLGLSIVHDAVMLHGGKVTAEKSHGRGTRFTVVFPAFEEKEGQI